MTTQTCHTVGPSHGHPHTHTIIFLHGRDSTNVEFAEELFESEASGQAPEQPRTLPALLPTVRWVFPAAPVTRASRFDADMSQWFDMWSAEDPAERAEELHGQRDGMRQSAAAVLRVLRDETARLLPMPGSGGTSRERIFLAGISQGFATALAAFHFGRLAAAGAAAADGAHPARGDAAGGGLAGMIGLCSWMPLLGGRLGTEDKKLKTQDEFSAVLRRGAEEEEDDAPKIPLTAEESHQSRRATPVLLCHSADDHVVPVRHGRDLRDILLHKFPRDVQVEWHEYESGGHWVNEPQGVDDMIAFVKRHM